MSNPTTPIIPETTEPRHFQAQSQSEGQNGNKAKKPKATLEFLENQQFWTAERLQKHHEYELTQGSAINPELAALNCESIQDNAVYEVLLYAKSSKELRRNDGRLRDYWLNRYRGIAEAGGLYFNGLDPQKNWLELMEWGRLKPDNPRVDGEGKPKKYESPIGVSNRVSYFQVPLQTWELIARRYNVPIPENIEATNFWRWVASHPQIPIILTEGEKKALCLLSMGLVAIALPGIWAGRVGNRLIERLHPDLIPIAQRGREFIILFDYETRPKTRQDIFNATRRTGQCIVNAGCQCKVALLPGAEKGIDDWVVALGDKARQNVIKLLDDALTLADYRNSFFNPIRGLRKHKPDLLLNTRYLSDAIPSLPETGLVAILSDLGTGKTELMKQWRDKHLKERFLNNGHRVNLLKNLAERLNTEMYSAINAGDLGRSQALSITIDSLYKMANNLQAYGCLFIDEAAQYVSHLLRSKTCKKFRAEILDVLEYLVRNSKLVVLADAHLDDTTIDFFRAMRSEGEQPFIIQNDWRSGGRNVYWYRGGDSSALVRAIHIALILGQKIIIVADSKRFIKKLERTLLDSSEFNAVSVDDLDGDNPEDEGKLRVWALHSENSGSEENVARIRDITNAVKDVDALLASPTIGTGVDICGGEGEYHFDAIFGAFHAISQPATECAQQLWRYRPNVPMHVWVAPRPPFGYQETNPRNIKEQILQKNEMTAFLIRVDRETGKRGVEKDWALDAYCQIEARRNRSINNLRADLRSLLEEMGNTIIPMRDHSSEIAKEQMSLASEAINREHCEAVASAADIDKLTYESQQSKDYLSLEEFLECEKFRLREAYGMEVTPELVEKDDSGRLIRKLTNLEAILAEPGDVITTDQGHEVLTPPTLVVEADLNDRENLPICTDWKNNSTAWMMRQVLGIRELLVRLIAGEEYSKDSEAIRHTIEQSHLMAPQIKIILGRTITPDAPNTKIIGEYLLQLGLSTQSRRIQKEDGSRERLYRLNPDDVEFVLEVLAHRRQKREERERRRREAEEKNAQWAAQMQRQYGIEPASTPPPNEVESTTSGGCGRHFESTATEEKTPLEQLSGTLSRCESREVFVEVVKFAIEEGEVSEREEKIEAAILYSDCGIRHKLWRWWDAARFEVRDFWTHLAAMEAQMQRQ